jgi:hypothetical protein
LRKRSSTKILESVGLCGQSDTRNLTSVTA